jgi:FKBP-type peptidyl-prolyl cis-trans isomerase FkpA
MRNAASWSLVLLLLAAVPAGAAGPEPKNDEEKTLYALGVWVARNLSSFELSDAELEFVKSGLADGVHHKDPNLDLAAWGPKIQALQTARAQKAGAAMLAKAAAEPGAQKTASGLVITTIKPGTGESPKPTDKVKVHYTGTLPDGTVFDSSVQRKEPATFPVNGVIPCWTEALQLMKVGGKSKLVCPAAIAYGDKGMPPRIRPGQTLLFDVELLEIVK